MGNKVDRETSARGSRQGLAVGNNVGDVKNDNKSISGSSFNNLHVNGNVTINNRGGDNLRLLVIAVVIVLVVLMLLIAFFIWRSTEVIRELPPDVRIEVGSRGGVYYVDEKSGRRIYLDRERGMELFQAQQQRDAAAAAAASNQ